MFFYNVKYKTYILDSFLKALLTLYFSIKIKAPAVFLPSGHIQKNNICQKKNVNFITTNLKHVFFLEKALKFNLNQISRQINANNHDLGIFFLTEKIRIYEQKNTIIYNNQKKAFQSTVISDFSKNLLCNHKKFFNLDSKHNRSIQDKLYNFQFLETPSVFKAKNALAYFDNFFIQKKSLYLQNKPVYLLQNSPYKKHIVCNLSNLFNTNFRLNFFKYFNESQSAIFLAEEIVYYLQKQIPFSKIKAKLALNFKSEQSKLYKGLRVNFSGRVGGRSKKAQRTKNQNFIFGQTSLHVFSSKLDFAFKYAHTPFGLQGIKVWVCYT